MYLGRFQSLVAMALLFSACVAAGRNLHLEGRITYPTSIPPITSDDSPSDLTSTTAVPATRALAEKTADPDPIEGYMKGITSPLGDDTLEYSLDFFNEKALMKEYDFQPRDMVRRLAGSAMAQGTLPSQFLREIQDLMSLQNRSRIEQDNTTDRDEISKLPGGYLSENLLKRMTEGWKNELKRLETKYNISTECIDSESITSTRLSLMFPHFINFGQKPFETPSNITIGIQSTGGTQKRVCDDYGSCHYEYPDYNVPSILGRPEFGGLIPRDLLSTHAEQMIIGTHLYALHRNDQNDVIPFRTKLVMLKRRMEKSLLSDERRFRFLLNNDIMHRNGTLLRTSIKDAYEKIPNRFTDKIDWDLLV